MDMTREYPKVDSYGGGENSKIGRHRLKLRGQMLAMTRRLLDEIKWAQSTIGEYESPVLVAEDQSADEIRDGLRANMERGINGALDEIDWMGFAYVNGLVEVEMLYDAAFMAITGFMSNEHVKAQGRHYLPPKDDASLMNKHGASLLKQLHKEHKGREGVKKYHDALLAKQKSE